MQKILVIESDSFFSYQLSKCLANLGLDTIIVHSIDLAFDKIDNSLFDVIVICGFNHSILDFIDYLTLESFNTKIFVLVDQDKSQLIRAFEAGVDDCLIKNESTLEETALRINRLLKYSKMQINRSVKIKNIELFPETGILLIGDKKRSIRKREAQILACLIRYKNNVVTRNTLIKYVWGSTAIPTHTTVDVYIRRLRLLLADPKIIKTVRGYGYMIKD